MDKLFSGRNSRRRLKRPAWWYVRGCSVPGCTIPLLPAGENKDEEGIEMRGEEMLHKNISFSQMCFECQTVLCRYHLSEPIDFYARWPADFVDYGSYPDVARLCSKCLIEIEIAYVVWCNEEILGPDTLEKKYRRLRGQKGDL